MKDKREEAEKLEKERREKVKTDIVTKKQFGPSKLFEPIYNKTDKKGDSSKSPPGRSKSSVSSSKSSSGGSKSSPGNIRSSSSSSKPGSGSSSRESNNNKKRKTADT